MLEELKAELKEALQSILGPAFDFLPNPGILVPFLYPGPLHWLFIVSACAIALCMYIVAARAGDRPPSVSGYVKFLVPKEVYRHSSAALDLKYYFVNSLFHQYTKLAASASAIAGLFYVGAGVRRGLEFAFGPAPQGVEPALLDKAVYTLVIVAATDLSKWVTHYMQHKIPLLWEFHKVHHSAEVLTPLTNLRVHPVDVAFENLLAGITGAVVVGIYGYRFSGGIAEITIIGMAAIYFVAAIFGNLRHSHIPFAFGPRLSKIFCSPVMHQFHHSAEARHFDKNFSVVFSLWDYLAGTIYIPQPNEKPSRLGIGDESREFFSVWRLYAHPFAAATKRIRSRFAPASGS